MMKEDMPAGIRTRQEVIPKDRSAAKGASPKEQEQRRLAKRLRKLKRNKGAR